MDIAKIRKKAKEQKAAQVPPRTDAEERPVTGATETAGIAAAEGEQEAAEEFIPSGTPSRPVHVGPAEDAPKQAEEQTPAETVERMIELLTFSLAKEEFAFRVSEVEEIIRYQRVTKVPMMPGYVLGITSLRGKIIPVIDLRARIVFREGGHSGRAGETAGVEKNAKILILLGPKGPIGVTVDKVIGVVRFSAEDVLEPPAHLSEEEQRFVDGVVVLEKRFVSVVSSEEALNIEVS